MHVLYQDDPADQDETLRLNDCKISAFLFCAVVVERYDIFHGNVPGTRQVAVKSNPIIRSGSAGACTRRLFFIFSKRARLFLVLFCPFVLLWLLSNDIVSGALGWRSTLQLLNADEDQRLLCSRFGASENQVFTCAQQGHCAFNRFVWRKPVFSLYQALGALCFSPASKRNEQRSKLKAYSFALWNESVENWIALLASV